jgi:hypothetical protein
MTRHRKSQKPRSFTPLQDELFQLTIDAVGPAVAVSMISKKFAAVGVRLSARERGQLCEAIKSGELDRFSVRRRKTAGAVIRFTSKDGNALIDKATKVSTAIIRKELDEGSHLQAAQVLKRLHAKWRSRNAWEQRGEGGFRRRLRRRWKRPFGLLRMLMTVYRESGEAMANALIGTTAGGRPITATVLIQLHARSCQVLYEVITLIEGGFADGAMARCRTLHEIAVTAMFLQQGGEDLTRAYCDHEVVESWKATQKHLKYLGRIAEKPPSPKARERLQRRYEALLAKYGKPFKEQYGWAAATLKKDRPSFADIELATNVDHLRPYYQLASHPVHANAKGLYFKLGAFQRRGISALATNHGFATPASNAVMSLVHTISALLLLAPSLDAIVNVRLIQKLVDEVELAFARTQRAEVKRFRQFDREDPKQ